MKLEKYIDKSGKRRKMILISISLIVLIGVSFLLYKTFASFTESAEFPMMKGKVDYFGNSDIYFVFYKNDELIDEMPQKNNSEKLVFDHGNCDNNAEIIWNASEWAPLVKGLNKVKTKCELYFAVTPLPTNIVASDITMSKSTDSWTKDDVEVTLKLNKYQGFILQYRTNKNTDWQDYKSPFKVSENDTIVYVKLKDTSGNESNEYQVGVVNNIDKVAPTNVSYRPVYTIPNYGGQVGFIGFHKIKGNDEGVGGLKYYFTNDKGVTWYPENGLSEENVKILNEDNNSYYPLANNAGNTYGMKVVDKLGNETITDYTDFTPYDPGFPYIQYVHIDDVNNTFDLNFNIKYEDTPIYGMEVKLYKFADVDVNNNYTLTDEIKNSGLTEEGIKGTQEILAKYNIDNIANFKDTYDEAAIDSKALTDNAIRYALTPFYTIYSDENGDIIFQGIGAGLYILYYKRLKISNFQYDTYPTIIAVYTGYNRNPNYQTEYEMTKKIPL